MCVTQQPVGRGRENASLVLTTIYGLVISETRRARERISLVTFISPQLGADISHNVHDLRCGKISNFLNGLPCAMCERSDSHQRASALYIKNSSTHDAHTPAAALFLIIHTYAAVKPKVRSRNACIIQQSALSKMHPKMCLNTFGSPTASHRMSRAHNAISRAWRVYSRNLYIHYTESRACV